MNTRPFFSHEKDFRTVFNSIFFKKQFHLRLSDFYRIFINYPKPFFALFIEILSTNYSKTLVLLWYILLILMTSLPNYAIIYFMDYLWRFIFYTPLIFLICFHGKELSFIFNKDTSSYSYEELPSEIKDYLTEYEESALKHGKDVSKQIRSIRYVLLNSNKVRFGGYAMPVADIIFINTVYPSSVKTLLWHELGHKIFNYGHNLGEDDNPIMLSGPHYTDWEQAKDLYFQNPVPRRIVSDSINGFKIWYLDGARKLTNQPYIEKLFTAHSE